jgi:hypothetical protein
MLGDQHGRMVVGLIRMSTALTDTLGLGQPIVRGSDCTEGTLKHSRKDWCLMEQYTRYVGFDVSAETMVIAEAYPGRDRARDMGSIPYRLESVTQWVQRQSDARTLLVCYEAGPTGFGLARHLQGLPVACEVIASGLVPQKATDRVKTDRRDARKLAEDLRAGSLTVVHLPTLDEEAFRNLVRAQESAVEDRRRLRQRGVAAHNITRFAFAKHAPGRDTPGVVWGAPTGGPALEALKSRGVIKQEPDAVRLPESPGRAEDVTVSQFERRLPSPRRDRHWARPPTPSHSLAP